MTFASDVYAVHYREVLKRPIAAIQAPNYEEGVVIITATVNSDKLPADHDKCFLQKCIIYPFSSGIRE